MPRFLTSFSARRLSTERLPHWSFKRIVPAECWLFAARPRWLTGVAVCGLALIAGCSSSETIRRYEVAKPALEDRMLAAIVPHGEQAWFFKVTGKDQGLAPHAEDFIAMVRSLEFDDQGEPTWQAPEGWRRQADRGPQGPMSTRFATLEIDGDGGPYELTVTPLGLPGDDLPGYVLANVNRWRGQLGLRPVTSEQLPRTSTQFDLNGAEVTVVDLQGNLGGGAAMPMRAPFAGGGAGGPTPRGAGPTRPAAATAGSSITFDTPPGWAEGELTVARGGIQIRRQAAFEVEEGGQSLEVTVTRMPGSPSSRLININRWRGQIQLDPITEAELDADHKQVDIDGTSGTYVQLIGGKQAILGVVAFRDGMAWFIKLQGDHDLALQEREHFEAFLESIRFE